MNIHFTNVELFNKLRAATLVCMEVGSPMYGLNIESGPNKSDIDYLYIYATSDRELSSMFRSHHQLQYKEAGVDHNFVSLHTFLHNSLNGDSTINFEVINSGVLRGTCLGFLYDDRMAFHNYSVVRSYLGLCRRDMKHYHRCKTHRERVKRIVHIIRGCMFAEDIMNDRFDVKSDELLQMASDVRSIAEGDHAAMKDKLSFLASEVGQRRDLLNLALSNGTLKLPRIMNPHDMSRIDEKVIALVKSHEFRLAASYIDDIGLDVFRDAIENWVEYEK